MDWELKQYFLRAMLANPPDLSPIPELPDSRIESFRSSSQSIYIEDRGSNECPDGEVDYGEENFKIEIGDKTIEFEVEQKQKSDNLKDKVYSKGLETTFDVGTDSVDSLETPLLGLKRQGCNLKGKDFKKQKSRRNENVELELRDVSIQTNKHHILKAVETQTESINKQTMNTETEVNNRNFDIVDDADNIVDYENAEIQTEEGKYNKETQTESQFEHFRFSGMNFYFFF